MGLAPNRRYLLFGADSALTNPYKGFGHLVRALEILDKKNCNGIELLIFGSSHNTEIQRQVPYPCHFYGYLHDAYTLNLLYNAADVFCMPSTAEAFGQTALESIFCGTPVVAFDVGGLPDFVSEQTGYLARYGSSEDFARGIETCLSRGAIDNADVVRMFGSGGVVGRHEEMWARSSVSRGH